MNLSAVTRSQVLLVAGHAASVLLTLAVVILLGRKLAPADFGFVALVSSLYMVAIELLDMGTSAVATREIAGQPARERDALAALMALRRVIATVLFAAMLGLAFSGYATRDDQRIALAVAAFGILLLPLHGYRLVFQVRQAYGQAVALGLATQVGFLVASVAALKFHAGGAVIGILVVAREASQALAGRWVGVRILGRRLHAPWRHAGMWPLLKSGAMVGMAGAAYRLTTHSGGFILWEVAAPEALASFSAAQKMLSPLVDVAWLYAMPLIASLTVTVSRSPAAFRSQLDGYAKLLAGMSCQVAVAGYFVAPFLLRLAYGEQYASGPYSSVGSLRWLALGNLFALVTPVLAIGELARGNSRALLLTGMACLGLNLAGNAWAIPASGAEGAAMVLCACEALVFTVLFVRCVARGDASLDRGWVAHAAPAAFLGVALSLLHEMPALQLALACAWAPATLLLILRLPAQRACRASLAAGTAHFEPQPGPPGPSIRGNAR